VRLLQASLQAQEVVRFHAAWGGFDRAVAFSTQVSPNELLAVGLAQLGQPGNAFRHAEASLARGLIVDLAAADRPGRTRLDSLLAHLKTLDDKLLPLFGRPELTKDQKRFRDTIASRRRVVLSELTRLAAAESAQRVCPLGRIQKEIAVDNALVFWLDIDDLGEHWGCVVRREGPPAWLRLPGSGKDGAWTAADRTLAVRLYRMLLEPTTPAAERDRLALALVRQRLGPLEPHLKTTSILPAVRRLLVVPTGPMALVPVEALSERYTVGYVPSGSVLARIRRRPPVPAGGTALALGDPVFSTPPVRLPQSPKYGLLLTAVLPGGNAARAGLRPGDVLLSYGGQRLESAEDLRPGQAGQVKAVRWREGEEATVRLGPGALGAIFDSRSPPAALRAWRRLESSVVRRADPKLTRLPGTRSEVLALKRLLPGCTTLLGTDASEQTLYRLACSGKLRSYRIVHLGTHGLIDLEQPLRSHLALARDQLPTTAQKAEAASKGQRVFTGELSVKDIALEWQLDAELVVLSACQTALGHEAGGDGLLGFAQAFLQKGARSVMLSRWKVDDTATSLLMVRFYENLLGKRKGLKTALGRAEALSEAKKWLRQLPRKQAGVLAARLAGDVLRGSEGDVRPVVKGKEAKLPEGNRPFAHPFYWAAFVLVGDPG
jgi:hypothetical protein